jgi:hypothetical protein
LRTGLSRYCWRIRQPGSGREERDSTPPAAKKGNAHRSSNSPTVSYRFPHVPLSDPWRCRGEPPPDRGRRPRLRARKAAPTRVDRTPPRVLNPTGRGPTPCPTGVRAGVARTRRPPARRRGLGSRAPDSRGPLATSRTPEACRQTRTLPARTPERLLTPARRSGDRAREGSHAACGVLRARGSSGAALTVGGAVSPCPIVRGR